MIGTNMISRNDLENLIVQGIAELRAAESGFAQLVAYESEGDQCWKSLVELRTRADQLDSLLDALSEAGLPACPEAA